MEFESPKQPTNGTDEIRLDVATRRTVIMPLPSISSEELTGSQITSSRANGAAIPNVKVDMERTIPEDTGANTEAKPYTMPAVASTAPNLTIKPTNTTPSVHRARRPVIAVGIFGAIVVIAAASYAILT